MGHGMGKFVAFAARRQLILSQRFCHKCQICMSGHAGMSSNYETMAKLPKYLRGNAQHYQVEQCLSAANLTLFIFVENYPHTCQSIAIHNLWTLHKMRKT